MSKAAFDGVAARARAECFDRRGDFQLMHDAEVHEADTAWATLQEQWEAFNTEANEEL